MYNSVRSNSHRKIITNNSASLSDLKPIPPEWESLRRKVASEAGRHAIIAGGAIRDHILGLPVKDIDIFVLGMSAQAAKQNFGAHITKYAGVEEAKHQYHTRDGLTVDLIFSRYDNVHKVLEHFDLGICRVAWDGWDYVVTDDFEYDRRNLTITTFYPSPSGHRDRVLAKLRPIGFELAESIQSSRYVAHVPARVSTYAPSQRSVLAHEESADVIRRDCGAFAMNARATAICTLASILEGR